MISSITLSYRYSHHLLYFRSLHLLYPHYYHLIITLFTSTIISSPPYHSYFNFSLPPLAFLNLHRHFIDHQHLLHHYHHVTTTMTILFIFITTSSITTIFFYYHVQLRLPLLSLFLLSCHHFLFHHY